VPSPLPVGILSSKEPHGLNAVRWQTAGRPHTGSLEGRQTSGLGRHGRMYCGWFVCGSNTREAGAAMERAAELKIAKYSGLKDMCLQPIAVASLGPLNETACQFLKDIGRRISAQSGDEREIVLSCSKGYLLSFNDSMLSCSTTVLSRQTTWANGHSSVYSSSLIYCFLALGIGDAVGSKIIIITTQV